MAKTATIKTTRTNNAKTIFDTFESWGSKNDKKLLYAFIFLSLLFSALLFNARISEAHDDALYLEGGWRYVHEFPSYFYTQNAPLYVMFLGLLVKVFGFKLLLFKIFNVIFNLLSVIFFYKTFNKRIPYLILLPVMLFVSCNYLIQYFASMTFTEAFYLFLQSLFFYYFFKLYDALRENPQPQKHIKLWLMLGLFTFLISACKSVAIVGVPALILFFLIEKQWKNAAFSLGAYLAFKIPYELIVRLIWGSQNQFDGQSKILLLKDPYNKAAGNDDLSGFIGRFFDNCELYLSKRFFQILGFQDEHSIQLNGFLALLVIVCTLAGLYFVFKKKEKPLFFLGLFTGAQILLSFIILQARWDQPRIILICMPVMLILIFYFLYQLTYNKDMGRIIYIAVIALISFSVMMSSVSRGMTNIPVVKKNLAGDIYFGYTPDWRNFLKCSRWCADSLPANTLVASRKAPMSFVYGNGKKFFPIYSVIKKDSLTEQSNPDSALAFFRQNGVTHVMLGSLRIDPTKNTGQIINTVHNIVQPIMQKYPEKLKLIHTEGDVEQSYVLEIKY
ncbi:MAG: glycosyltransferase family 39 protein [Bacteroidetes bacterium]|nr:glycosyltransferase family 39 protein [Bacteroidota bacterium]